jgi:hypothetical protein
MAVVIKWGKERYETHSSYQKTPSDLVLSLLTATRITIPLPPPDTKIQFIRQALTEYTQLPEGSFKLIHSGAVMKDNAPS